MTPYHAAREVLKQLIRDAKANNPHETQEYIEAYKQGINDAIAEIADILSQYNPK